MESFYKTTKIHIYGTWFRYKKLNIYKKITTLKITYIHTMCLSEYDRHLIYIYIYNIYIYIYILVCTRGTATDCFCRGKQFLFNVWSYPLSHFYRTVMTPWRMSSGERPAVSFWALSCGDCLAGIVLQGMPCVQRLAGYVSQVIT